ncbi:hypothetical protein [Fibrobacter sp. UWEL]|uniref:hypothetical protein n=1 Tax=Fibrobacter sp. UWEL TaxID=1896209 RepID=UPI001F31591C|nr:hypothetical protein [Fibrobacter sp. UWEL]
MKKPVRQTETYCKKAVCLRERLPCPRSFEICRFHLENKSKNSIFHKDNLKTKLPHKKFTKALVFHSFKQERMDGTSQALRGGD